MMRLPIIPPFLVKRERIRILQTRGKRTGGAFVQGLVKNVLKTVAWKGNEPRTFG